MKQPNGQSLISVLGEGPVVTDGKSSATPISIAFENRPLLDVYLSGGSFELYADGDNWQFYCDTPGTRFALYDGKNAARTNLASRGGSTPVVRGATGSSALRQVAPDGKIAVLPASRQGNRIGALFPANAAYVRLGGR